MVRAALIARGDPGWQLRIPGAFAIVLGGIIVTLVFHNARRTPAAP